MENNYKRTIAGSVGAGVGAIFNASGRKFYILEHKTESKYHHAGESQKIIVDQVELGRDASCQVRFDETFETVSRRHAAIVRDGENWKLVPLSQTNATLVNGQPIHGEWILNSGDEIRLSSRGPLMGFIIPKSDSGAVKSLSLTERMQLFSQQALRPYKVAIFILIALLALLVAGLAYMSYVQDAKIKDISQQVEKPVEEVPNFADIAKCNDAVYYVTVNEIKVFTSGNELYVSVTSGKNSGFCGTGFILDDGRFVTAHRTVEPWRYSEYDSEILTNVLTADGKVVSRRMGTIRRLVDRGYSVVASYTAYSPAGTSFQFYNTDMTIGALEDRNDWATLAKKEQLLIVDGLKYNRDASLTPSATTEMAILGYPAGKGFVDSKLIKPVKAMNNVNVTDLNNDGMIELTSRRYQPGNDGAPVLQKIGGQWVVVGVLSHTDDVERDVVVPIANVK